jgi:hypothetical protein
VEVYASVEVPHYFMRLNMLGFDETRILGTGKASRRDINLILILDRSGSMAGTPCTTMKSSSKKFVQMFAEGRDRIGLLTYSTAYTVALEPTMNFLTGSPNILGKIDSINCQGWTVSPLVMQQAWNRIQTIDEPGTLNIIVFFTDGVPTALPITSPLRVLSDDRFGYSGGPSGCTNTGSNCSMPPSPCKDPQGDIFDRNNGASSQQYWSPAWNPNWQPSPTEFTGVMAGGSTNTTGSTEGLFRELSTSLTDDGKKLISIPNGCASKNGTSSTDPGNAGRIRRDIAYIPKQDTSGNSTVGYKNVSYYSSGHRYPNQIRPDRPSNVQYTAMNATDDVGKKIRLDGRLATVVYTIGLGDIDEELLIRVANDPRSAIFDSAAAEGLYVYAADPTQLDLAFQRVASEILRISK